MNIFGYSVKSFRHQMGKGIIFMIVLAVMLMTSVMNVASSMQQMIFDQNVSTTGDAHAQYNHITEEQAEIIEAQDGIEWSMLRLMMRSYVKIPDDEGSGIGMCYFDHLSIMDGFSLQSGKEPEEQKEIMMYPHTARTLGVDAKAGTPVSLQVTNHDGSKSSYDMVICGIIKEQRTLEINNMHTIFVSKSFALQQETYPVKYSASNWENNPSGDRQMMVKFSDATKVEEKAKALGELIGIEDTDIGINHQYLSMVNPSLDFLYMAAVVLVIVILAGILVIYNAFNVLIVKRTQQYGLLTLIGASKKQVRSCVYLDAVFSALVALPAGMAFGTVISYVSMPVITSIFSSDYLSFTIWPWTYGLTAVLTLIMVFVGAVRPSRKAASVTPVEAVKFTYTPKVRRRKTEKESITLGVLARLNLNRSRGRTIGTVLALSISGILLLSIATISQSMYESTDEMVRNSFFGNITVYSGERTDNVKQEPRLNQLNDEMLQKIKAIDGVDTVYTAKSDTYTNKPLKTAEDYNTVYMGTVIQAPIEVLSQYVDKETADKLKTPGTAIAANYDSTKEKASVGDVIKGYFIKPEDQREHEFTGINTELNIEVVKIVSMNDMLTFGLATSPSMPVLFVAEETYHSIGFDPENKSAGLYFDESRYDDVVKRLDELFEGYEELSYSSSFLAIEERRNQLATIFGLVFVIVGIIALIGILNLVSSVFIGIQQRQKEFGTLIALGLSKKGLKELLWKESLFTSFLSTILSSAAGLSAGYILYRFIQNMGVNVNYYFPLIPFIILLLVYTVVPLIVTFTAIKQMSKKTTVELLGQND